VMPETVLAWSRKRTDDGIVFRAAHDSSKAMRIWMGEMKKKS